MRFELYDLYPLILFAIVLISLKPIWVRGEYNNYLSKDTCQQLRGILAIIILLYHISQKIKEGILLTSLSQFGYLAVSVFYFFSGYGLQKQYIQSDNYKKSFLQKRLPKIVIPYLIAVVLFWILYNCILDEKYTFLDVLYSFVSGHPIVTYSWYIISILAYYIAYWLIMIFSRGKNPLMLLLGCLWQLIYMFVCWRMGYSEWWYIDSHLLIVGIAWASYENIILIYFKKYFTYIMPMSILILVVLQRIRIMAVLPGFLQLIVKLIIPIFFMLSIICLLIKIRIRSRILMWLGGISLNIYILQGLPILGLRNSYIYIDNEFIWISMIICMTIGMAKIISIISLKLYKNYSAILVK